MATVDVGMSSAGNVVLVVVDDEGVKVSIPLTSSEAQNIATGLLNGAMRATLAACPYPIVLPQRDGS